MCQEPKRRPKPPFAAKGHRCENIQFSGQENPTKGPEGAKWKGLRTGKVERKGDLLPRLARRRRSTQKTSRRHQDGDNGHRKTDPGRG